MGKDFKAPLIFGIPFVAIGRAFIDAEMGELF